MPESTLLQQTNDNEGIIESQISLLFWKSLLTTEANAFKEEMIEKIKHVSHINRQHIYSSFTAISLMKMISFDERDGKFFLFCIIEINILFFRYVFCWVDVLPSY
jgi:hypothetical protein